MLTTDVRKTRFGSMQRFQPSASVRTSVHTLENRDAAGLPVCEETCAGIARPCSGSNIAVINSFSHPGKYSPVSFSEILSPLTTSVCKNAGLSIVRRHLSGDIQYASTFAWNGDAGFVVS